MIIWMTPDNKRDFSMIIDSAKVKSIIDNLTLTNYDINDIIYLLSFYQIEDIQYTENFDECKDTEEVLTALFKYKLNNDDTTARDAVINYILCNIAGRGIVIDLNSLFRRGVTSEVISKANKVKPYKGFLQLQSPIVTIDTGAYANDLDVQELICSDTLTTIQANAFTGAYNLEAVQFKDRLSYIGDYAFYGTAIKELELPKSLRIIDEYAFAYCKYLTEVKLNEGLTKVGARAFMQDVSLCEVDLPSTCKTLGDSTFAMCNSLRRCGIPSVEEIGDYCFYENRSLVSICLPSTLKTLGMNVFEGCTELKEISLPANIPNFNPKALYGIPEDCKILIRANNEQEALTSMKLFINKLKYEVITDA